MAQHLPGVHRVLVAVVLWVAVAIWPPATAQLQRGRSGREAAIPPLFKRLWPQAAVLDLQQRQRRA